MEVEKQAEFVELFKEFVASYPYTNAGLGHRSTYNKQRQEGRRNYHAILSASQSGEDVTEAILLKLLPYPITSENIKRGAWVHHSALPIGILEFLKKIKKSKDWRKIALSLLSFIEKCNDNPYQLSSACHEFYSLSYDKEFSVSSLTSILNALRPDDFLLITYSSCQVINYLANTSYRQTLRDYPVLNMTGRELIKTLSPAMQQSGVPALRDDDLFDMFCEWLTYVKKYKFTGLSNQKIQEVNHVPSSKNIKLQPEYTLDQCAEETGMAQETLEFWVQAIERTKQAILYGPPGTGKTFIAKKITQHLISGGDGFTELIQFHPAYTYEDFIQGIRPQQTDGKLDYPLVDGRFLNFCKKARNCQNICVLIIDEINRANIARVFGELMYLLEYRDETISLATGEKFSIPANVRIIGTMNTADRSIALVDHALRRRFAFIALYPNYDILRRYHASTGFSVEGLIKILIQVNQQIDNPHYEIGCSFFLRSQLTEQIESIWRLEIEPYLEEYLFDQPAKVSQFRWNKIKQQILP